MIHNAYYATLDEINKYFESTSAKQRNIHIINIETLELALIECQPRQEAYDRDALTEPIRYRVWYKEST